jgi:hypothetical protein
MGKMGWEQINKNHNNTFLLEKKGGKCRTPQPGGPGWIEIDINPCYLNT